MVERNPSDSAASMPPTAKGGFPAQQQELPGSTARMDPVPDHGQRGCVDRASGSPRLVGGCDPDSSLSVVTLQ